MPATSHHSLSPRHALTAMAVLTLLAAMALFAGESGRAHALTDCTLAAGDPEINEAEAAFLDIINEYRAEHGLGALQISRTLSHSATWMAIDLAEKDYFAHTEPNGRNLATRLTDCEYPAGGWAGENLAAGNPFADPQAAFEAWRNSPTHNANMLRPEFTLIGIAREQVDGSYYGHYWVTDFGQLDDPKGLIDPHTAQTGQNDGAAFVAGLGPGQHLVTWPYGDTPVNELAAAAGGHLSGVYAWHWETRTWEAWLAGAGDRYNDLDTLSPGIQYWIMVR